MVKGVKWTLGRVEGGVALRRQLRAGRRPRLVDTDKDAETIVRRALDIAADICVYTNRNVTIESL